ncbi:YveK family protein [Pseudogracilibacillus sp. ICA-222130]|uniref:YveK family protein n=1 Tax=Pseudogracilibacillus sp. ICA-222130 TaxID=3134655 RepID=UPI0030BD2A02
MEETIELQQIFTILKKRIKLIIGTAVAVLAIAAFISFVILTPIYESSTQLLVNKEIEEEQFNTQDIQTNLQLIETYSLIIKSPAILDIVAERLNDEYTVSQLNEKISVNSVEQSQVIDIKVQDKSPNVAATIANETAKVFQEEIVELMSVDNVKILSQAELSENPTPVKPNPKLNMAIGLVLGAMLGIGIAFLLEYLDTTVKNEKDVEDLLDLPVLGGISTITEDEMKKTELHVERRRRGKVSV